MDRPQWSVSGGAVGWTYLSVFGEMNIGMEVGRESGQQQWNHFGYAMLDYIGAAECEKRALG